MSRLSPVSESNSLTLIGTNLILADPSDEASAIEFAICDLIADQYRRAAEERTVSRDFLLLPGGSNGESYKTTAVPVS